MSIRFLPVLLVLFLALLGTLPAFSHCQVPCGIYDDQARIRMMGENITTIEKAMKSIIELTAQHPKNPNQIVRWVITKEDHADDLAAIITEYFMAQRIIPVGGEDPEKHREYIQRLTLLHQMLVVSMKCKQTTDLANVEKLRSLLAEFERAYFGPSGQGD